MSAKLLTLAVPTYNMEKYLARCLDSVLCANKDFLEVLVVNDGSKDRSSEIAHKYENMYPDVIRAIDKENGNYGSCVNRAIDEATGKYFRMLDADDWCDTEALNRWLEKLKTCDADMVLTISEDRKGDEHKLTCRMDAPTSVIPEKCYNMRDFDGIKLGYKYLFCSHIITYKTEILRAIHLRLQHGISYTDNEYVYFPMNRCHSVVYYDLPIYQYFVGREGQTTDPQVMTKSVNQILQVFNRLFEDFQKCKNDRIEAVRNNQLILLSEMLYWIYGPAFKRPNGANLLPYVERIEKILQTDEQLTIQLQRHNLAMYGMDVYAYYRQTGRFVNHPITKVCLFFSRIISYIQRRLR